VAIGLASNLREKVKICGKKRYACYAVAVYFSCSLNHAKRDLREFHTVCTIDIKNLNFAVKTFRQYIGDKLVEKNSHDALISSTISKFSIPEQSKKLLRKLVLDMVDQCTGIFDSGRKPRTIIASLIMMNVFRSNISLDVREIADVMQICHSSISSSAKELSKNYNIQF
jgi:transcription initiation factor TFIIIB Brf1 subunit/transcription initiation factor TFIIB